MPRRVTQSDLRERVRLINRMTGHEAGPYMLEVEYMAGRPRLYRRDGSVEVSPRYAPRELAIFLDGMAVAIDILRREA